ncbi:aryl-sulfate sulfotransferase [Psychroserpens ponticola]|uniref:Aryl-sulfate sulfotransferase n=1 Tax=Psychroserpens ponticola TaxID=2932268 RepID=A0ABY7RYV2_9FLAO|nr:aryl-sulfate sulfotransferase [Psychroserpens ponticola]WCO02339.1 aryl-sulfate sulfotransferase [Psychroserpens ponticola]
MTLKKIATLLVFIAFSSGLVSQNTVGVISYNQNDTYNGLTLFTSLTETYLINSCGEVVNQWTSAFPPGNAVYLLEDGSLLRAGKVTNTTIMFGGTGGIVEKFDWEGNLTWSFTMSDDTTIQHHDIFPMPNGNILILAVTIMSNAEAIQAGRDPNLLTDGVLFNEQILEIEPLGINQANVVWEWNIKDHLIQDFDVTKDNFGVVENNPQLLDINFLGGLSGSENWLHMNSIQYNNNLDQIVMSARHMSEIYIIDHSTSTAEASGDTGGIYNKGGDFLYRWGNPQSYRQGTQNDQKLFGQHYPHWIPDGLPNAGQLILYNNGFSRTPSFSEVFILTPPTTAPGVYDYTSNTAYGPTATDYTYTNPVDPINFFSRILSGAQVLPNGNILICDGDSGYFFEIDSNENIVWEYINPSGATGILSQGDDPEGIPNLVFRAHKYGYDNPAFTGRDLTPGNPIELNSGINEPCDVLSTEEFAFEDVTVYPNPATDVIKVNSTHQINKIEIYNSLGAIISQVSNSNEINVSSYNSGIYFVRISSDTRSITKKIIKH